MCINIQFCIPQSCRLERAMMVASAHQDEIQALGRLREQCAEAVAETKVAMAQRRERCVALHARACELGSCGSTLANEDKLCPWHRRHRHNRYNRHNGYKRHNGFNG